MTTLIEPKTMTTLSITQAIAIPYRITSAGRPKFCMITSKAKKAWIFPKGTVDGDETIEETALKEALEEAGLRGELDPMPLGSFSRTKSGCEIHTYVYLMRVDGVEEVWPELDERSRRWRSAEKAMEKLGKPYLAPYLERAIERVEILLSEPLEAVSSE